MGLNRVDWRQVIFDLNAKNLSVLVIARKIRVERTSVIAWRDIGREPFYRNGRHLLLLWAKHTGRDPDKPPFI